MDKVKYWIGFILISGIGRVKFSRLEALPVSQVSSTLAMMELKGMVRQLGGMEYVLNRETRGKYRVGVG